MGLMGLEGASTPPVAYAPVPAAPALSASASTRASAMQSKPHVGATIPAHANHAAGPIDGKQRLDKNAMKLSKFEYYLKAYLPYAILLFLLLVLIAYAVMTGMTGRIVAQ